MLTIQRILFPTDFSEGAKQAFPQAAFLADWHDAELHILNVTSQHRPDYSETRRRFPVPHDTLADWLGQPVEAGAEAAWPDLEALSIVQEQIEARVPAASIVDYAEDEDIDLVVMSTHGRRGLDRVLLGSVTEEVVRTVPCPVLTVRAGADVAPGRAVRRVLVPVDFSDASEAAILHAKEMALTYGAEIDLLHVVNEGAYPLVYGIELDYAPTDVVARAEKRLGKMAEADIGYEHIRVEATVGHPPTRILEYAEENDIDLLVLATHGRTGLGRFLIGSVAERVIRQSPKPVFVVKPDRKSLVPETASQAAAR